jgi:hypothetical protein
MKIRARPQLWHAGGVYPGRTAAHEAKTKMLNICTSGDFLLIMLHRARATRYLADLESKHGVNRSGSRWASKESTMTASLNHGSATIYQFPVGGRGALSGHREQSRPAEVAPTLVADVVSGSWYHDAAIRESEASREH